MIKCSLDIQKLTYYVNARTYTDFNSIDWATFAANIRTLDWEEFFTTNDLDLTLNIIYKPFQSLLNHYPKTKTFTCQKNNNWLPNKLKRHLRKLERSYHRLPTFSALINLQNAHKNVETQRFLIIKKKKKFWFNLATNLKP